MKGKPAGWSEKFWWLEALFAAMVFGGLLGFSSHLLYQKSLNALEQEIKLGLLSNVKAATTTLSANLHQQIDPAKGPDDPPYRQLAEQMEKIRLQTQDVRYIYTIVMRENRPYFMVNPSPQNDSDGDGLADPAPALLASYDHAPAELLTAFTSNSPQVSASPYQDQWGVFISAYAPLITEDGKTIAVLAMDLELSSFYQRRKPVSEVFGKAVLIIVFLSLIVGLLVYVLQGRARLNQHQREQIQKQLTIAQQQMTTSGIQQLNARGFMWCWRFGVMPNTQAMDLNRFMLAQDENKSEKAEYDLRHWFSSHQSFWLPTPYCQVRLNIPSPCIAWFASEPWRRFWQHTFWLWQQSAGRAIQINIDVKDFGLHQWRVQVQLQQQQSFCRHSTIYQPLSHYNNPESALWPAFLEWQQQAQNLDVRYSLKNHGELLFQVDLPAWPDNSEQDPL